MKLSNLILKLTIIFNKITKRRGRFTRNQWGSQQAVVKGPRDDPDGSKKGMSEGQKKNNWVFLKWKFWRHGRRHKSVWDPWRRVWEATRRVLEGLTTGSRRHRSRYGNGDERCNQIVPPSVISGDLMIKTAARTEIEWTNMLCCGAFSTDSQPDPSLHAGERE